MYGKLHGNSKMRAKPRSKKQRKKIDQVIILDLEGLNLGLNSLRTNGKMAGPPVASSSLPDWLSHLAGSCKAGG